jgi:hypothetical protein
MNADEMTTKEKAAAGICPKCGEKNRDVCERYSFGIFAGTFCEECCKGFRDNCGLDGEQGSPNEMIEAGEDYYGDDDGDW